MAKKGGKNDPTKGNNICKDMMGAFYVLGIEKKDSVARTQQGGEWYALRPEQ